jgi:hypothetical protein
VFAAIHQAAVNSVRSIRDRILCGEQVAATGQDPDIAGWSARENILWNIANRRPLLHSDAQLTGVGLFGFRDLNAQLFFMRQELVPFLVLLICQTGPRVRQRRLPQATLPGQFPQDAASR